MSTSERLSRFKRSLRWMSAFVGKYGHLSMPLAASILTLCSTWIILGPVLNRSGDNIYHLMNEWAIMHAAAVGDSVFGPLGLEFGAPILRFYQSLYYLNNVAVSAVTGLDLRFVHNLTIVVCFAASPFAYLYFLMKLGLNRWTAGVGSMLSMISVAAFGNSFEAYHQAGIVTQSMGGLFFPWFMGNFIGMLRGENRASTTGALFALAFLSHAIMAVYATFAGAIYFAIAPVSIRPNIKRLAIFAAFGIALVAFWLVPFLDHTARMRPVPESIIRGKGVHWFTSVSTDELAAVLAKGYLFDDPRATGDARNALEKHMDKISIIGTIRPRPPVLTGLIALGCLFALLGIRKSSHRFLLGGLAFSLMLFAGPDDYRWMRFLPFMKQIQTFRVTCMTEFFAFGVAAVGIEGVLGTLYTFARKRKRKRSAVPALAVWVTLTGAGLGWVGAEIIAIGQTHLRVRDPAELNELVDAASNIPNRGYPFRFTPKTEGRFKLRHAWLAGYGYHPYCTHWKGVGPTAAYHLCSSLGAPKRFGALHAATGVRWFGGMGPSMDTIADATDKSGVHIMQRWPNGKDRRNRSTATRIVDTGNDHFLRPFRGKPLPVVCNHKQWIWLTKAWTTQYRGKLWDENTPFTMRVEGGDLEASGLLADNGAVFYFDHTNLEADRKALTRFAAAGGTIITPIALPGISATVIDAAPPWQSLPPHMKPGRNTAADDPEYDDLDPGLEVAQVEMLGDQERTYQWFEFDVDTLEPIVAMLPMGAVPGWKAILDGKEAAALPCGPDMIAMTIPRGAHRVAFYWEMPPLHAACLYLSLFGALALLTVWGFGIFRIAKTDRYLARF